MKLIEKYVANDGTEFSSAEKCLAHEALCAEIDAVMARLPQIPVADHCEFENGHGYIQHSEDVFWPVRDELLRIGNRLFPPLYKAWYRIMCVYKSLREWGQLYFVNNPDKIAKKDMVELRVI